MLLIQGDFNARLEGKFSFHDNFNRNGNFLRDFAEQHSLVVGNTNFQKPRNKLWTWRSPRGDLAQIDYCLYRKRWRNSVSNCQAYSSSNPIGSDHRIVSTTIQMSFRTPKPNRSMRLNWQAIRNDKDLGSLIGTNIAAKFNALPDPSKNYSEFLKISNQEGLSLLPKKKNTAPVSEEDVLEKCRKESITAPIQSIQAKQQTVKTTHDNLEEKRINDTLKLFESKSSTDSRNAWNLVKELSGKKSTSQNFISGEDRLKIWKDHFKNLLNNTTDTIENVEIVKVFEELKDIQKGDFDINELTKALKQMKNGKAPGSDCLPVEFWKIENLHQILLQFCNSAYHGNRPTEWGLLKLIPVPKKGDLSKPDNYRGISLAQSASKIFNRLILNRIRPAIDKVLRPNQNGFRENRSTSSHLLALRRLIEELKNHKQEAVLIFIDFKKAFDSIIRDKMFSILEAYGIPLETVNAIRTSYRETSCYVSTPDGDSDSFDIVTGVMQGDPLAPFLFIICLDYAMRSAILDTDGIVLKRRRSRRHPPQRLCDLDFADDIALIEETIKKAEELLHRVERDCQHVGLCLNPKKTKFMLVNSNDPTPLTTSDGSIIERVDDFTYLGGLTNTANEINVKLGKAWGAINALTKVWKSPVKKETKINVFRQTAEWILLYGSDSWTMTKTLERFLDGKYTKMLRVVCNVPPTTRISNKDLYGNIPPISTTIRKRRLALAGHVARREEPASQLLMWSPDSKRKTGRPSTTLKTVILEDTGLTKIELNNIMKDREAWRRIVIASPSR